MSFFFFIKICLSTIVNLYYLAQYVYVVTEQRYMKIGIRSQPLVALESNIIGK